MDSNSCQIYKNLWFLLCIFHKQLAQTFQRLGSKIWSLLFSGLFSNWIWFVISSENFLTFGEWNISYLIIYKLDPCFVFMLIYKFRLVLSLFLWIIMQTVHSKWCWWKYLTSINEKIWYDMCISRWLMLDKNNGRHQTPFFPYWMDFLLKLILRLKWICVWSRELCSCKDEHFYCIHLPRNTIPIAWAFSRGNEMVAYVVPRSAAKPESSDWAGDMARSPKNETK